MRPTVGKILHAGEAELLQLAQERLQQHERIGAVHAREHRRFLDNRQHFARHLDDDVVGVAIGEQARERAAAGHAVAAGIVDDDEIDAAGLLALGRKAGAGAAADDRLALRDHRAEFFEDRLSLDARHGYLAARRAPLAPDAISRKFATNAAAKAGSLM